MPWLSGFSGSTFYSEGTAAWACVILKGSTPAPHRQRRHRRLHQHQEHHATTDVDDNEAADNDHDNRTTHDDNNDGATDEDHPPRRLRFRVSFQTTELSVVGTLRPLF
jgi:hypothetical protein